MTPLSKNTQAILLLTESLGAARREPATKPLTPKEYQGLAARLVALKHEPADLLTPVARALLRDCALDLDTERVLNLLARGLQLGRAVERWDARAIWVISRADAAYPKRLKARLREDCPAILFGCGDCTILDQGGLAVVGPRKADEALLAYADAVGRLAAGADRTVVSGGARGIDLAAMRGALSAGGRALGVLADSLERLAIHREFRQPILDRRLLLVTLFDPSIGFLVGHAMQRNKSIYALADAALVVDASLEQGGTWAGAKEQLRKFRSVPVYVRTTGGDSAALAALRDLGALPWPNPANAEAVAAALSTPVPEPPAQQVHVVFDLKESRTESQVGEAPAPAQVLHSCANSLLLQLTAEPTTAAEIAVALAMPKRVVDEWLRRLVEEGALRRLDRPVRFVRRAVGLF